MICYTIQFGLWHINKVDFLSSILMWQYYIWKYSILIIVIPSYRVSLFFYIIIVALYWYCFREAAKG